MNSKQRAYLRKLANQTEPIFQIGKGGDSPEITQSISEALEKRELVKISVLKNCPFDARYIGELLAERTRSTLVQVIGRKITLYRESTDYKEIELPKK